MFVAAQLVAAALLFFFVGREFARQWAEFQAQPLETDLHWGTIAASGLVVLGTYALLVQVWRILMAGAGATLPFWRAARVWSVSNLWRYVPGKVWQIGAMSALAHRENVPPVAAAGAAVLSTVLNIATGLAIVLLLGWRWIGQLSQDAPPAAIALLIVGLLGLLALPHLTPRLSALAARLAGRDVQLRAPPTWALALAVAGNMLSWALYGLAFMWLTQGVLGDLPGAPWQYVAVFTASYVVGYLFLIVPGGIGPREAVMVELLISLSLATPKQAALIAVASRVWLTILEIVPGLLFMAFGARRPSTLPSASDASTE